MDWEHISKDWKRFSIRAAENWTLLKEDELTSVNGQLEKLEALLQERYGFDTTRARAEVAAWLNGLAI